MIAPEPRKMKCTKCGFRKLIKSRSDVLALEDILLQCPKCRAALERSELNGLEKVFAKLF